MSEGLLTPLAASDEMKAMLWAAWQAETPALNGGSVVRVVWQNDDEGGEPPLDAPWARAVVQHMTGQQATLGEAGGRRFERRGVVSVQVFAPLGKGVTLGQQLAKIALDVFEGNSSPGGVWFCDCRIREVGRTALLDGTNSRKVLDPWDQTNVTCTFVYDEIK